MARRFAIDHAFVFEDYNDNELVDIFKQACARKEFKIQSYKVLFLQAAKAGVAWHRMAIQPHPQPVNFAEEFLPLKFPNVLVMKNVATYILLLK